MPYRNPEICTAANWCENLTIGTDPCGNLVGQSRLMQAMYSMIRKCADYSVAVLIMGETGTGKELVARAIHDLSHRRSKPFVAVNCSALSENLVESELFGHERGAFSGAIAQKTGRFEAAADGTLFLDEISELPFHLQAKLLRVLQEKEIERVGGLSAISINARTVAASNKNLANEVMKGRFREDLYYRLNVFPIQVPPLRQRKSDIPLLIGHFIDKHSGSNGKNNLKISPETISHLMHYSFPGNVRELENFIARAMILIENNHNILHFGPGTDNNMEATVVKGPWPGYLDREALHTALKKIRRPSGLWHRSLRCISLNDLLYIFMKIGPNPFSRSLFAKLLQSRSTTESNKYKTAGEYLKLLTQNHICTHNGRHANRSRYQLAKAFLTQGQAFRN
jgi:transcriptional regulator with GAF, ATPase, and Fis domain